MIYTKIYNLKIKKDQKKLFDLWWKELIELQEKNIKSIEKILQKQYKEVLKELLQNTEVKYNDVFVDQSEFIEKDFLDNFNTFVKMIKNAFKIWKKQIDNLLKKEVSVETWFWLKLDEIQDWAKQYSAERIKNIDDYSRKRIKNLISEWIEKGWGYNKLAEELKKDYAFSNYRARLIASNEIWTAYIQWKDQQFNKYRTEFGQTWWKKWVSHKDDRTTDWCLANDNEWWIEYDQDFQSWHKVSPRFPWCRCNIQYRLFNPNE